MVESPEDVETVAPEKRETSHLVFIITEIESILATPDEFTSTTPESVLLPLLEEIQDDPAVDADLYERISRIRRWCTQLDDACRAAYARDTIKKFLKEIESFEEWTWEQELEIIQSKRSRIDEIRSSLNELPIEFLKQRVKELRREEDLHPPAYLTIHITFSLLPPLSTLHSHLQVYRVRFRVWDISQTFFNIVTQLKSYITVPRLFSSDKSKETLTSTEALTLTVEAGILLDRMIDISVEEKGQPIPEEWIDEFERVERMVTKYAKEDLEPETPCPPDTKVDVLPEVEIMTMKRDFTRSSIVESVFDSSPRSMRMDDSMSSIDDDLPEHLIIKEDSERNEAEEDPEEVFENAEATFEEEVSLEDALEEDDSRIFDKEYHAIDTPPREDSLDKVDYSPFIARVLAEFEKMEEEDEELFHDTLESEDIVDSENDVQGEQQNVDETEVLRQHHDEKNIRDDIDVEALYNAMINASDSDSEDDPPPQKYEIRTSSPIFEDKELDFQELDSDEDLTTTFSKQLILDSIADEEEPKQDLLSPISLNPFSPPKSRHVDLINSDSEEDIDETITVSSVRKHPTLRTPSPEPSLPPETPLSLRDSQLHSKVAEIAHSHPTIALIPHTASFRPTQSYESGYYTLRPSTSHSRHSSVSSDAPEPRRVDVNGVQLFVRILSDRVMVRVGGGWVELDQYLREYIGKRESTHRRRSGSVEPLSPEMGYEFLEVDERRRCVSSLGMHSSPPRGGGRNSSLEVRRSVSPFGDEMGGIVTVGTGTRRVYVRRK